MWVRESFGIGSVGSVAGLRSESLPKSAGFRFGSVGFAAIGQVWGDSGWTAGRQVPCYGFFGLMQRGLEWRVCGLCRDIGRVCAGFCVFGSTQGLCWVLWVII